MLDLHFTLFEHVTNYFASMIDYDVCSDAPSTYEGIQAHYDATGRLSIWDGASDDTIFSNPASNYAFRAWHDFCHIRAIADFTHEGERRAMLMQMRMISEIDWLSPRAKDVCFKILQCEVMAQLEHARVYGDFPNNQRQFSYDTLRGIV